jgi:hypothetical protein
MSSPFAIFRKNQRVLMAGVVFVSVIAFVVAPAIQSVTGNGRSRNGGPNPVLASWSGGSIRQNELEQEWEQVRYGNQFLRKLASDVIQKGGMPNVPEFNPDLSLVGITSDQDSRERIIERKLLVAEANRMGIHFDDESVKKFLERFVDQKMSGDEINKVLADTTNRKMNFFDFSRLMREELAKNEVLRLAGTGVRFEDRKNSRTLNRPPLTTPSKNWQDFLKFNRAAKIQAFPVFAVDFESQVKGKPTEKEVQELYAAGKNEIRSRRTMASQPAFMRPKTANFEYITIDVEKFIVEQMALVPNDTLSAEYARRVKEKQFRVPVTPEAVGTPTTAPSTTPTTEPTTQPTTDPVTPPTTEPATPEATKPSEPGNAIPPAQDAPKPTASLQRKSAIQLVSFQEPTATPTATPTTSSTPPTLQEPIDIKPIDIKPIDTKPAEPKPADVPPTDTAPSLQVGDKPLPTIPNLPAFPQTGAAEGEVAESTPMRTKTFEEVRDQIARDQATAAAYQIIEDRINDIVSPMSIYQSELRGYRDAINAKATNVTAPVRLDLAKIAKELGFEFQSTGMVDQESIQGTTIGTSFVMPGERGRQPFSFVALVGDSQSVGQLYNPVMSMGFTGGSKRYVAWKIEETDPVAPSMETVRTQIEEVWKKQQALKLAEAKASEIAGKVGTSTLKDSMGTPEDKALVLEPTNFTWFNPMFARMESRLQLSTVELLQPVEDSFMETVFSTTPGKTTVAPDSNKTIYYVIQVVELSPDVNNLLSQFASTPLEGVSTVSRMESDRALQPWFQNLQKQLGFRAD